MDVTHVGKTLFGNPVRLKLAIWALARDKRFFQSEPPNSVGVPTAVRQELGKLVALGMLEEQRIPGDNRLYYERTDSPLWKIIATSAEVFGSGDTATT